MKCIRMLTFIPLEEIDEMDKWDDSRINEKKAILAYSLTALVHGEEEAKKAQETSLALFSGAGDDANMPHTVVEASALTDGAISVADLLVLGGIAKSKGEAKRLIEQGGISVDGEKVTGIGQTVSEAQLKDSVKIKKGKKIFHRFSL